MQQITINIEDESKAKFFIDFIKQLDFIQIENIKKNKKIIKIETEINESFNDLKNGNLQTRNNKKIILKNA